MQSQVSYNFIQNFHTKQVHLPRSVVVAPCTEPPLLITDLPQPGINQKPTRVTFILSDGPVLASVHYKPAEEREAQESRQ